MLEAFEPFDHRQLRLLVTAISAQRLFWVQQQALAESANDAELGAMATRYVRDHEELLTRLRSEQGAALVDTLTVKVERRK